MNFPSGSDGLTQGISRVAFELLRIGIIAGLVFGFYQWKTVHDIGVTRQHNCLESRAVAENQALVLRSLIRLVLTLDDRQNARPLRPLPASIFNDLERALSRVPQITC